MTMHLLWPSRPNVTVDSTLPTGVNRNSRLPAKPRTRHRGSYFFSFVDRYSRNAGKNVFVAVSRKSRSFFRFSAPETTTFICAFRSYYRVFIRARLSKSVLFVAYVDDAVGTGTRMGN